MFGLIRNDENWIAIFKKDALSKASNVISWKRLGVKNHANVTFRGLATGNYQLRVFYYNSYNVEQSFDFYVSETPLIELETSKETYTTKEKIEIDVANMLGDDHDWIAVYPKGSSNDWSNVIDWTWLHGKRDKHIEFSPITEEGEYELRAFFKDSYTLEASYSFKVVKIKAKLTIEHYLNTEQSHIFISIRGVEPNKSNWVGIYPKGSDNAFENVIQWQWVARPNRLFGFNPLPVGEYEARAFFNNSFIMEEMVPFKIIDYSIDKNKLLIQAKKQCLQDTNSTEDVLCSRDLDTVYILTKRKFHYDLYFGHYQISLSNNSVKTINE